MIRYVHDLYPRTNPKDGARLVRFTHQQLTHYLHQRNGTGSGKVALRATTPDAAFISPLGLDYVRVVRINTAVVDGATLSGFSEKVVGGYFLEEGDFLALDRRLRKLLTLQGAGTMSVLDRSVMWSHSYLTVPFNGTDPQPGVWPLYLAGTGNALGAILWRVITEALNFENPAVDADDRTESAIGMVTMTFTYELDSSGNPWTVSSGDFVAQIGESVLSVVKRLMEAGLYVEMDPDTFELSAWEVANHGRDRTGGAWATDVLRFEQPADQVAANGNILSDLKRAIRAIIRRSKLLAGSAASDIYATADGSTDVPWEGFYSSDAGELGALGAVATRQVGARDDAGDTVQVRIKVGNDPANGRYLVGEHVQTDDLATLHTGTAEWEWDEAAYPVAAWSVTSRRSGAPDAFAHLGAIYHTTADRQFQAAGHVGPHTHRPNPELCRAIVPAAGGDFFNGRFDSNFGTHDLSAWGDIGPGGGLGLTNTVLFIFIHAGPTVDPDTISITSVSHGRTAVAIPGSTLVNGDWGQKAFYIVSPASGQTFVRSPNSGYCSFALFENVDQSDPVLTLLTATGTSTTAALGAFQGLNSLFASGGGSASDPNETTGQTEFSPSDSQGFYFTEWGMSYGVGAPSWTMGVAKQWTLIGIAPRLAGAGSGGGDGHADLIGTSIRAKRCDDTEHYHTTADPTVNDDTSAGFRNSTLWINESTGAMFLLLDNAVGAADWLAVAAGVTDHGALTGLGDDDHPQYATNAEFDDHDARHENGGADEMNVAGLNGELADPQPPKAHAASHANGGADEVPVEGLATVETDTALVLHPDGAGGIEWGTDEGGGGGSGIAGELITDTIIGDGATDTFALSVAPTGTWALVSTNGVDLLPAEYAIVGGDIVFDTPPAIDSESTVTFVTGGFTAPAVDPGDIADPTLATAEDVANKLNDLMAELRATGVLA